MYDKPVSDGPVIMSHLPLLFSPYAFIVMKNIIVAIKPISGIMIEEITFFNVVFFLK